MVVSTSFANARRPAAGARLDRGIEAHALRPMDAVVAEERALPATEEVKRHGDRSRDVDPDHAGLDPVGKVARGIAILGEDAGAVSVFVLVDEGEIGLEVGRARRLGRVRRSLRGRGAPPA